MKLKFCGCEYRVLRNLNLKYYACIFWKTTEKQLVFKCDFFIFESIKINSIFLIQDCQQTKRF